MVELITLNYESTPLPEEEEEERLKFYKIFVK
jgi:hypothetical protein